MKKLYLLLASIAVAFSADAQQRYLLTFKDKGPEAAYYRQHPEQVLSQRALERRQKAGLALQADDLPVSRSYLAKLQQHEVQVLQKSKWLNAVYVETELTAAALKQLHPAIRSVRSYGVAAQKPAPVQAPTQQSTTSSRLSYGAAEQQIVQLGLDCLHDRGYQGSGVLIAVFDTGYPGINTAAPFDSMRSQNRIVSTRNFVDPGVSVYGNYLDHGTSVLSIISANAPGFYVGAAARASYALAITEDMSGETHQEELNWAAAAEWADSLGADIIQCSLGYKFFDPGQGDYSDADIDGHTPIITRAADKAAVKGMLVVIAAGNDGGNSRSSRVNPPCDGDSVLCVGSVNASNQYSPFSSVGPTADGRIKPEVVARGSATRFVTPNGNIGATNGTSLAAPLISGLAACLWQANPQASNMQIYQALIRSADKYTTPDYRYGYGLPSACLADSLLKQLITALPGPVEEAAVTVYPTATASEAFIQVAEGRQLLGWQLFSATGQRVAQAAGPAEQRVNLQPLAKGLYVLVLQLDNGRLVQQKLLKQ